jgi:hypothetical protein
MCSKETISLSQQQQQQMEWDDPSLDIEEEQKNNV